MRRNILFLALSILLSTLCAVGVVKFYMTKSPYVYPGSDPVYKQVQMVQGGFPDFTYAAENAVNGVVHVKVLRRDDSPREATILEHFFGYGTPYALPRESVNSGSGVIISRDGYIVTNNHVVDGGTEIVVTMNNNKTFKAKVVGADPVTDVALLKVEGENLPAVPFGRSDSLRLGEWVLAIGSPYNLRSTVTAGIVSAKGRSLPDASGEFKIESFIQTDAVVNPGNSGGALVNTSGELVGINTAIATNTGSYTGYSFAVPEAIVKKVVADIQEYGSVQRAMLGISMQELTDKLAQNAGMEGDFTGVYIPEVQPGGAAEKAGMKEGDVIVAIDGTRIKGPSDIQEKINGYRPQDNVTLTIIRNGAEKELVARLQGQEPAISEEGTGGEVVNMLGARLEKTSPDVLRKLKLKGGVQITSLQKGKFRDAGIKEGLIITHINQIPVNEPKEVMQMISKARRSVLVEGVYPNGSTYYYGVGV